MEHSIHAIIPFIIRLAPAAGAAAIKQTTVNGRTNPLGIAADDISFAWAIDSEARGVVQSACQIRAGTKAGRADVWDSGRIASGRQID